jgi:hypothetical protein
MHVGSQPRTLRFAKTVSVPQSGTDLFLAPFGCDRFEFERAGDAKTDGSRDSSFRKTRSGLQNPGRTCFLGGGGARRVNLNREVNLSLLAI